MFIKLKPVCETATASDIAALPGSLRPKAFYFSALPESIQGSMSAKLQSFDIISKGTVKVPKGTEAKEISWNHVFFGAVKKNEPIVMSQYWQAPESCIGILQGWMNDGTVLNLLVSGTWINMDVVISSFEPEEYGAFGNVKYSIKFVQKRDLKIYTTNELKIAAFVKKVKERTSSNNTSSSKGNYTVVSGDTLWGIASKKCGGGSNWTKLYDANKDTIESTAKKHGKSSSDHGHWIWPGEVFALV